MLFFKCFASVSTHMSCAREALSAQHAIIFPCISACTYICIARNRKRSRVFGKTKRTIALSLRFTEQYGRDIKRRRYKKIFRSFSSLYYIIYMCVYIYKATRANTTGIHTCTYAVTFNSNTDASADADRKFSFS